MLTALGWNPFIDKTNGPIDWIDTFSTSTTAAIIVSRGVSFWRSGGGAGWFKKRKPALELFGAGQLRVKFYSFLRV